MIYAYSRVSTGRQASEGESLDVQQQRTSAYAVAMMDGTVAQSFVERGVSGTVAFAERPEGSRLWASLRRGDAIVSCKLDRMFRSSLDALDTLAKLQEMGVKLYLIDMGGDVTSNGIAKLVFTILSAVAEAERERTRERVQEVKSAQRAQGRYLGGKVPFGWEKGEDGRLVEVKEKQEAINMMGFERDRGFSLRDIAKKVEQRHGFKISHKAVSDILARDGRMLAED